MPFSLATATPLSSVALHRARLEDAVLSPDYDPEALLALSRKLDRLINDVLRVRSDHFRRLPMRAVRPRRRQLRASLITPLR